ncbi:methyl-accepting chemotaxis protein [Agathobaculum sp. Marseille-P7918]|uniref:methyl-accepting chemotaxis protein n=1 Tax=Agathobaculum sp. Marseille-P7918 TaxID=2479843 RepID=UPI003563A145
MKSVKGKILLGMVATIVIGMLVIGIVSIVMSLQSSNSMLQTAMQGTAEIAASRVEYELRSYIEIASTAGQSDTLSSEDVSVADKEAYVNQMAKNYNMTRGNLLDLQGNSYFDGNNYSDREYFQRAKNGESFVSTPTVSKVTGELSILVAAPVYQDGDSSKPIIGVVYFVPQETFLNDIMTSIHVSANSEAFMLDKTGITIADITMDTVGNQNIEEEAKTDPSLEQLAVYAADMRAGNSGVGEYKLNGTTKLLAYAPIDNTDGWSLGVAAPETDFMGAVYTAAIIIGILIVVIVLIGIFIAIRLATSIGKPIQLCAARIHKLSEGDLSSPVPVIHSKDETGKLAEQTASIVQNLQNLIGDIGYVLGEMAGGNFNVRSRDYNYYIGDYEKLLQHMRGINIELSKTMAQINTASAQVSAGAEQVSSGAQSLAQGATEQASAVQELSATINDISTDSQRTAKLALQAKNAADNAGAELQASSEYIATLGNAMSNISESSQEISKIISTIENIAFQTNILALNAAVEAARAGAAGKGFAVVADEVRNLAHKSDQAAKATKDLIEKSIGAVNEGVNMMQKVSEAVGSVMESASVAVSGMDEVADAVQRETDSIVQITQGIDQISSVVQTNSATAEESAAASEELSGQSEMLKSLISGFKVRQD